MNDKMNNLVRLESAGLVAIVRLSNSTGLANVAEALLAGGVQALEFTLTTPGALDILRETSHTLGDRVLLGAGTVLDAATARAVILAGAQFVVSPTFNPEVIQMTRRYSVIAVPGAFTPTEILAAWEAGADIVKVFPASIGGPTYLKEILVPLPQVKLMPTGGVNLQTAAAFIKAGAIALGVGSALVDQALVTAGRFNEITARAQQFVEIVNAARCEGGRGQ